MKILHLIDGVDSKAGGPAMAMAGLAKAQRDAGLEVFVLATFREGSGRDIAEDLERHGVHVTLVGPARGPVANHPQLAATLRATIATVDVVHAHGIWEEIQHRAARICCKLGKPYVITAHGMLTPWSLSQKWLKKRLYLLLRLRRDLNDAAAVHFTSTAERDATARLGLQSPAIVEPLGVDLAEFEQLPAAGSFRARFPALAGRKIILFLGRLHRGKGMEYLIPALQLMKLTDVMLVAVGPDSVGFIATLQELAEQKGVADRVLFTGMMRGRERLEALTDADVFALPSEHENFGIVVVEALACGTPAIVSTGVALHSEVTAAHAGSSVPVGDVPALAEQLDRWLEDDEARRHAGERGRHFVWQRFDWRAVAQNWVTHYNRLASPET